MKTLHRFRVRSASDSGDAILTMGIIFTMLFVLLAGFAIDITKSVYAKSSFQVMAQESTSEAARFVDARGSLTAPESGLETNSVQGVVNSYKLQFDRQVADGEETGGEGKGILRTGSCTEVKVGNVTYTAPYMEITLSQARGALGSPVTYKYDPVGGLRASSGAYMPTAEYQVVSAKVYDTAPNLMLGIVGIPCQQSISEVSSITFGSQEDVEDFYSKPETPVNPEQPTGPVPTTCPSVTFSGTNMTWNTVTDATSWTIYKNGVKATDLPKTTLSYPVGAPAGNSWKVLPANASGTNQTCPAYTQ